MCGIYGYFDSEKNTISDSTLKEMGNVIAHRGPDGNGCFHDLEKAVAVGNQRLAILDPEHGEQPFYSTDRSIIVVQNGEIFNHVELAQGLKGTSFECETNCDTEVILRLYEKLGVDGLNLLNGMFAIAIYDRNIDAMYLIRDRVGEKPLYYTFQDGRLVFGSEIKSILQVCDDKEVSASALNQYLAFNYVPPPLTMFEGVKHVMPGCRVKVTRYGLEESSWWDLAAVKPENKPEPELIDEFNQILSDAVRIRLRSDVPFGAFLSGGVDSSTVVGLMSKYLNDPVKTFSIGFNDPKYDESPYAQQAADLFNTDHIMQKVEANTLDLWPLATYHCDQPHGDVSFLPTYKVASLAAEKVKMVLTGDGADELFAGYDKYKNYFNDETLGLSDEAFKESYLKNISLFDADDRNSLYSDALREKVGEVDVIGVIDDLCNRSRNMDRINQALYIDTMLLLPGNNLVKPDRMGMAVSLENRAPFLDYRMVEFSFSIPGKLKLKNGVTKYLYKKAVCDLIGDELAYRKKQMFTVPVGDWFKSELKDLCEDLLLSEKVRKRNLFDYEKVAKMYSEHCDSITNYTRELRALMALEIWYREFIDK
ncbi:asparagine synthase (glutamine-hydrolyzing) [Aliamphritea hakodatensis]|uniref:asparagine synthase (glutamine-hydrolyzing) n=1 Tax=Aliamphritea hakodatensis TaxID=2895352 RepID=UPI0022FD620A|nr:asparagine synthase (glutamine-hydrolyzing) [Aliamphritea hakodatensis]